MNRRTVVPSVSRLFSRHMAFIFLAVFVSPMVAQQHFPSNEDLRHLRNISSPQLSPDLKHVVVSLQDSTADGGKTHLWLLSAEGGPYRQLTFAKGPDSAGESAPMYLPDGSAILFISRQERQGTLFRLPLDGGEAVAVKLERSPAAGEPAAPVSVVSYSISPDGFTIAVIAQDTEPASRARNKKDKRDAIWVDHEQLKSRLYLVDAKTWEAREVPLLTEIDQVAWTHQSDRLIAIIHTRSRDLGPSSEGWIVDAHGSTEPKRVTSLPETLRRAAWMNKSQELVLFARCEKDAPFGCSDLYTFDIDSGKLKNVSRGFKDSTLLQDTLIVAPDDRSVLIGVARGVKHVAARFDFAKGDLELLNLGFPVISNLSQAKQANAWVYVASASTAAPSIYMTTSLDQPGKRFVQPEPAPPEWKAVASKPISWKREGYTIEGLLYLPPQAVSGRVPLVVNVHGGPTGQFTDTYYPLVNLLVGQGWAVLLTNPRGSTGYGIDFEAANKEDMGNGDYLDIMAGVDETLRINPIDSDRMALIGYSYGGEMAAFVAGKTTRFKALVCGAPVIDQFSEYGTEASSYGDRWFTGEPWRHFQDAWRQSPLAYAEHAKTPFLLLQGQADTTDPEGQSEEMYRALRQEGVPVQMLLFPREDHGALGGNFSGEPSTEPWHGVIARDHMIRFISDAFAGKVEPNKP
jgi:dipeptidyl aminopeptidase/acylaminoacyl peptidase